MRAKVEIEWWLCGECLSVSPSGKWGVIDGNPDTAVCPVCKFGHRDDENSVVEAGTFAEMQKKKQEWES